MNQATMIDQNEAMELWQDPSGCTVSFIGDRTGGSSLLFAYHEQQIYSGETRTEENLDAAQIAVIEEWFEEYEA